MRTSDSQNGGSDVGIVMTILGIAVIASAVLLTQSAIKGCKEDRMRGPGAPEPTPRYPIDRVETIEVRPQGAPNTLPTQSPSQTPQ